MPAGSGTEVGRSIPVAELRRCKKKKQTKKPLLLDIFKKSFYVGL